MQSDAEMRLMIRYPRSIKNTMFSLHDALPILSGAAGDRRAIGLRADARSRPRPVIDRDRASARSPRSEEHTSELQSHSDLVCRLLHEKKKMKIKYLVNVGILIESQLHHLLPRL